MRNEFPLSLHFFCSFGSKGWWTDSQRKTLPDYHVSSSCVVVRDGRACHFSTLEVKGGDLRTRRRILPIREGAASHLLRSSFNQLPIQLPRLVTVNRFTFRLHAIEQLLTLLPAGTGAKLTRDKAKLHVHRKLILSGNPLWYYNACTVNLLIHSATYERTNLRFGESATLYTNKTTDKTCSVASCY